MNSLGATVVKDLRDTASATAFELRKHVRRRRLVIAVTLALLIPLAFYLVPRALGVAFAASATLFAGSNLGFAGTLILISSTFFGGDAISSELDKRTFLVSYVAPQRRTSVYAGKFLAAFLATALVAALYFGVIFVEMESVYGFGEVPAAFSTSFALALLYALAALSVAFTFSSLMRSTISSNMLSFFTMFLVLPIVAGVLSLAGVDPWLVPTYYASLITSVFGGSAGFAGPGGAVGSAFAPDFHVGLAVVTGWSVALIVSSAAVTARRQME